MEKPLKESTVRWNIKHLIASEIGFDGQERSLLFDIPDKKFGLIIKWCLKNPTENATVIAEMILRYPKINDGSAWHKYAKRLIDEFGFIKSVLSSLTINLGNYSWSGSIVPLLERKKRNVREFVAT